MWRPKGWETETELIAYSQRNFDKLSFEAGADAMLEALKKNGQYGMGAAFINPAIEVGRTYKGWLIFIEDREVEGETKNI